MYFNFISELDKIMVIYLVFVYSYVFIVLIIYVIYSYIFEIII